MTYTNTSEFYSFNINHYVYVKLNDLGKQILLNYYIKYKESYTLDSLLDRFTSKELPEYQRFQHYQFSEIFGSFLIIGKELPFDPVILFEKSDMNLYNKNEIDKVIQKTTDNTIDRSYIPKEYNKDTELTINFEKEMFDDPYKNSIELDEMQVNEIDDPLDFSPNDLLLPITEKKSTTELKVEITNLTYSDKLFNYLKKKLLRNIFKYEKLHSQHNGKEQKYTYWGGFDMGYVKGQISFIENLLDEYFPNWENK